MDVEKLMHRILLGILIIIDSILIISIVCIYKDDNVLNILDTTIENNEECPRNIEYFSNLNSTELPIIGDSLGECKYSNTVYKLGEYISWEILVFNAQSFNIVDTSIENISNYTVDLIKEHEIDVQENSDGIARIFSYSIWYTYNKIDAKNSDAIFAGTLYTLMNNSYEVISAQFQQESDNRLSYSKSNVIFSYKPSCSTENWNTLYMDLDNHIENNICMQIEEVPDNTSSLTKLRMLYTLDFDNQEITDKQFTAALNDIFNHDREFRLGTKINAKKFNDICNNKSHYNDAVMQLINIDDKQDQEALVITHALKNCIVFRNTLSNNNGKFGVLMVFNTLDVDKTNIRDLRIADIDTEDTAKLYKVGDICNIEDNAKLVNYTGL